MRKLLYSLIILLLSAPVICGQHSYSTNFPLTENPISEGGKWVNGGTTGLDWTNILTTANTKAYGSSSGTNPGYNDSTAVLQNMGFSWGANQAASAVVFLSSPHYAAQDPEAEIVLNMTISAHSEAGYSCNFSVKDDGTQYALIGRWNGPSGNFTAPIPGESINTGFSPIRNGDTIECENIGGVITMSVIHVATPTVRTVLNTATDHTYTGGSPGIATDLDGTGGTGGSLNGTFGFSSFSAADGAGGTCPTGANYTNPANPTGTLVTLASFGVSVKCYFISSQPGASDSNDGASKATPWIHAPMMPNCSGNCATLQNSGGSDNTLLAGIGFIFRGGDIWYMSASDSNTPNVGGTWDFNAGSHQPNGTITNPIYLGVDKTWFSGGAWARPIFTGDNPPCNATLVNGTTCSTGTIPTSSGVVQYYVSSCAHQVGSSNIAINIVFRKYYYIDNFELTGLCLQDPGKHTGQDEYFSYGSMQASAVFTNNYVHNATHLAFGAPNGPCSTPSICFGALAFDGGTNGASGTFPGESLFFNVVDFCDSDTGGQGFMGHGGFHVAYNAIRCTSQALPGTLHSWHDNLYEHFLENGHSNVVESGDIGPISVFYNNVIDDVDNTGQTGTPVMWLGPTAATDTVYAFNNVVYNIGGVEYINWGGTGLTLDSGHYVFFSNTFQENRLQGIVSCPSTSTWTFADTNNHFIDDSSPNPACTNLTSSSFLWQSNTVGGSGPSYSNANASPHFDQYTASETYAYSPVASTNSTVGAGTNEQSICTTLLGSTDALIQAAGTACQSDTTYGVSYNATNHTVSFPTRTVVARPASAAWNVGAYQFSGGPSPIATFTPSPLVIGQVPVGMTSNPSVTVTLQNTGTANLVVTAVTPGAIYALVNNVCGTSFTLTPTSSCTFQVTATPTVAGAFSGSITFSDNAGNPDVLLVTGTGTGPSAPAVTMAGTMTTSGTAVVK